MENVSSFLDKYKVQKVVSGANNERATIIEQFVNEINKERVGTKYKPLTGKFIAIKLSVLKSKHDLYTFFSECQDYKSRHGSFGKRFFGGYKPQAFKNHE